MCKMFKHHYYISWSNLELHILICCQQDKSVFLLQMLTETASKIEKNCFHFKMANLACIWKKRNRREHTLENTCETNSEMLLIYTIPDDRASELD